MSDQEKKINPVVEGLLKHATMENFSKLVLGTKKSGHQRAVYDIVKDYTQPKKKKKKGKKGGGSSDNVYSLLAVRNKKKKKKKKKHWRL